jgi:hypothetical protein
VVPAVRYRHLLEKVGRLKPGGFDIFIIDYVAFDARPEMVAL